MKILIKPALLAGLALAVTAPMAVPAQAQISGIATSNPEAVFVRAAARIAAYEQINTAYTTQIQQINTLRQETQALLQTMDTDKDGQLSPQEQAANPASFQQVEAKQQQSDTLSQPIALAQYYVIEQLINDYSNAQNQVIQAKNIKIMLTPDAFQYSAEGVDVTEEILAAVNQRLPAVTAIPPTGYRPRQATVQMHQSVQQIIIGLAQRAAAQQAAQQDAAAQPAPSGR